MRQGLGKRDQHVDRKACPPPRNAAPQRLKALFVASGSAHVGVSIGGKARAEVLPENVLAKTDRMR